MGKVPPRSAEAGASARAAWRRARSRGRRRRSISAGLILAAAALVAMGLWQGDGRWAALGGLGGLGGLAAAANWLARPDPDLDRWRRGADGESETAALLSRLPRRWVVLHDRAMPASAANIDHLVIGPTGVWVIDTKTTRARMRVRGGEVWAGEHAIDTGPAAWQAEVVSERLDVDAVPLVAVHGRGLRRRGKRSGGVRVVRAARLIRRLRRGRRVLSRVDVAALARQAVYAFPPR
jgi:hypothetical protein